MVVSFLYSGEKFVKYLVIFYKVERTYDLGQYIEFYLASTPLLVRTSSMNKALDSINSLVQRYGEEVVIKIDKRIDPKQQMKSWNTLRQTLQEAIVGIIT